MQFFKQDWTSFLSLFNPTPISIDFDWLAVKLKCTKANLRGTFNVEIFFSSEITSNNSFKNISGDNKRVIKVNELRLTDREREVIVFRYLVYLLPPFFHDISLFFFSRYLRESKMNTSWNFEEWKEKRSHCKFYLVSNFDETRGNLICKYTAIDSVTVNFNPTNEING